MPKHLIQLKMNDLLRFPPRANARVMVHFATKGEKRLLIAHGKSWSLVLARYKAYAIMHIFKLLIWYTSICMIHAYLFVSQICIGVLI